MSNSDRKNFQIARRRETVARLYAEGTPRTQIAEQAGVSMTTIATDLKAVREQWMRNARRDIGRRTAYELAKIDRLEQAAWEGWQRSCRDAESTKVTSDGESRRAERSTKGQAGDPKFLDRVAWCINRRFDLMALRTSVHSAANDHDADGLSVERRRTRALAILDRLLERAGVEPARIETTAAGEPAEEAAS